MQPRAVVLHAHGALFFVEGDAANAVDVTRRVERAHLLLTGRHSVTEDNVQRHHATNSHMTDGKWQRQKAKSKRQTKAKPRICADEGRSEDPAFSWFV